MPNFMEKKKKGGMTGDTGMQANNNKTYLMWSRPFRPWVAGKKGKGDDGREEEGRKEGQKGDYLKIRTCDRPIGRGRTTERESKEEEGLKEKGTDTDWMLLLLFEREEKGR
jgi:hypothetical protein